MGMSPLREVLLAEIGCCSSRLAKKEKPCLISWEKDLHVSQIILSRVEVAETLQELVARLRFAEKVCRGVTVLLLRCNNINNKSNDCKSKCFSGASLFFLSSYSPGSSRLVWFPGVAQSHKGTSWL